MEKFDFSVFCHPRILYTELNLTAAAGALPRSTTNFNDLKCSRDLLIDFIYIGDDGTYATGNVTVNQSNLQGLNVNWQIADRAAYFPQALVPVMAMHNWWDCDRTQTYGPAQNPAVDYLTPIGNLYWRNTLRWVYNPSQSFRVDWQKIGNNLGQAMPGVLLRVHLNGIGLRTGHRRTFGDVTAIPAGPAAAAIQTGQIVNPPLMSNISDEPYLIEGVSLPLDATWWPGIGAGAGIDQDLRYFNYLRLKITPTQGEPWSDVPIPMAIYGVHMGPAMRAAWYKPAGGPILLKAGQAITFDCQNTLARATQVQIALIGRTAPGHGSLY